MKQKINTVFNIKPSEEKLVLLMLIHSFAIGIAISFFYTAASALFLAEYEVQQLPIIYILGAIAVVIVSSLYSRIAAKFSTYRVLLFTLVALIFFVTAVYLGLSLNPAPWLLFGIIVWFRIFETPLLLEFSSLASRMFDARQGKRLFGLLGTGESLARILGGIFIGTLVIKIGTVNLLLIAIGGLVLCLIIYWLIARSEPEKLNDEEKSRQITLLTDRPKPAKVSIFRNRYLLPILLLYIFAAAAKHFVDFLFFAQTQQQFASSDEMAAFLGWFFSAVQITLLIMGSFFSGRLISRFGLNFGLWVQPTIFGVAIALIIITSSFVPLLGLVFWFVAFAKLAEVVFYKAFTDPSLWVLFAPIEASKRLLAQVAIGGRGRPFGAGFAGIVLIIFTTFFFDTPNWLNIFIFIFAVAWVIVAIWTYREYIIMLGKSLSHRILDDDTPLSLDNNSLAIVEQHLSGQSAETTIYALQVLSEHVPQRVIAHLPMLLTHQDTAVHLAALQHIQDQQLASLLPEVRRIVQQADQPDEVIIMALHTIALLSTEQETITFTKYLDAEPNLRHAAIICLLTNKFPADYTLAIEELNGMLGGTPSEKQLALQIIGEANIPDFDARLPQFLEDEDERKDTAVQRAALITMGQRKQAQYWLLIIDSLFEPSLHHAAITAISLGESAVVPVLQTQINLPNRHRKELRHLIKVCRYLPHSEIYPLLQPFIDHPHHLIRTQVYIALYRANYHADSEAEKERIYQQVSIELNWGAQLLATIEDVSDHNNAGLLVSALEEQLDRTRTRVIHLIGYLYEANVVRDMHRSLSSTSTEQRALALEWMDEQLTDDLASPLTTLLTEHPSDEQSTPLSTLYPQDHLPYPQRLIKLIELNWTPWITICAAYAALKDGLIDDHLVVEAMSSYAETSIHDTYIIMSKITGAQKREEMLQIIEKVLILKSVELFASIPDSILAKVASLTEEVTIAENEDIIRKGETGKSMYIIVKGQIHIHDLDKKIATLNEKEIFGEMALLDTKPRMATATAVSTTHLLQLDHEPFYELIDDYPTIAKGIIRVLTRRLRALSNT